MRVAIYARVSKEDSDPDPGKREEKRKAKQQEYENQLLQLREYCTSRGWQIVGEYIDQKTGKTIDRPGLNLLFADAAQHRFDLVLVWALDRLTRGGVQTAFDCIERLKRNGVDMWSFTEEYFRSIGPAGELMLAVAAWIAKQERIRISERTKAGLERLKAKGVRLGPPEKVKDVVKMREMRAAGASVSAIARETRLSRKTVLRVLRAA